MKNLVASMSRNEVEIDLNKFMEMIQENQALKQKIFEMEQEKKQTHGRSGFIYLL